MGAPKQPSPERIGAGTNPLRLLTSTTSLFAVVAPDAVGHEQNPIRATCEQHREEAQEAGVGEERPPQPCVGSGLRERPNHHARDERGGEDGHGREETVANGGVHGCIVSGGAKCVGNYSRKFLESVVEDLHLYCSVSDCLDQGNPSSLTLATRKFSGCSPGSRGRCCSP